MARTRWEVRLGADAERDLVSIVAWTARTFGSRQAQIYRATILSAIRTLEAGPKVLGTKVREDVGAGFRTLHVARNRRRGRHFLIFRATASYTIDVLRILHDSMDLARHMSPHDPG